MQHPRWQRNICYQPHGLAVNTCRLGWGCLNEKQFLSTKLLNLFFIMRKGVFLFMKMECPLWNLWSFFMVWNVTYNKMTLLSIAFSYWFQRRLKTFIKAKTGTIGKTLRGLGYFSFSNEEEVLLFHSYICQFVMDLKMEKTSWIWKDHGLRGCDYFSPMAYDVFTIIILKYKKNHENHEYLELSGLIIARYQRAYGSPLCSKYFHLIDS